MFDFYIKYCPTVNNVVNKTINMSLEYGEYEYEEFDEGDEFQRGKPKKIPNQFNFCERAALTYENPMRVSLLKTKYYFVNE